MRMEGIMSRVNVLWVIDHVCYDGHLHGGGRLYWNVLPFFDPERFKIIPCLLRADETIRRLFESAPARVKLLDKGKHDPTTLWTFLRLIKKKEIQVMHLHCYGASTFGRLASLFTGVPAVIHDYDTQIYFPYPCYLWFFDRVLSPFTRQALAASPMVRDYMIRRRAIRPERVKMMFHAVPPEKYLPVPSEDIARARESLGLRQNDKVVIVPTKLGPQRGNRYLLRTVRQVLDVEPKALFLVAFKWTHFHRQPDGRLVPLSAIRNKEQELGELQELVSDLGIEQRVRFIESWKNLDEMFALSDCIVAPFLSERFSSVNLLEGMARGKPIIATDLGEQREFIEDGVNGYLVPPGDEKALAESIIRLLVDRDELLRMSKEAKTKSEQYSLNNFVHTLQALYTELAANHSP